MNCVDGGRFRLWKVYFRDEDEAIYFSKMLTSLAPNVEYDWTKSTYWGNEIHITKNTSLRYLIISFVRVFIEFRLQAMLKDTIQTAYHYEEEAEIQQILQWTNMLFYETEVTEKIFEEKTFADYLFHLLYEKLAYVEKLHFDTIVHFCMKPLKTKLLELVGMAIDEMREEEAYQDYLQALRTYVARREPKCDRLYVVKQEELAFYDESGRRFSDRELVALMQQEPLYVVGLHTKEKTLAPLLALLPQVIYLYCDQPLDTKVVTILNVFEERVKLFTTAAFPFSV